MVLNLSFLKSNARVHFIIYFLAICVSLLEKCLDHLRITLFVWSYLNSLCALDIYSLSYMFCKYFLIFCHLISVLKCLLLMYHSFACYFCLCCPCFARLTKKKKKKMLIDTNDSASPVFSFTNITVTFKDLIHFILIFGHFEEKI